MEFQGPQGSGRRKVRPVEEAEAVGQVVEFLSQLGPLGQGKLLSQVPPEVLGSGRRTVE